MLLNSSNGTWDPQSGIPLLKSELHEVEGGELVALTDVGVFTSDYSCHQAEFCVVQAADFGAPESQPQLYRVELTAPAVPTMSPRGLTVMTLLVLATGALALRRRSTLESRS